MRHVCEAALLRTKVCRVVVENLWLGESSVEELKCNSAFPRLLLQSIPPGLRPLAQPHSSHPRTPSQPSTSALMQVQLFLTDQRWRHCWVCLPLSNFKKTFWWHKKEITASASVCLLAPCGIHHLLTTLGILLRLSSPATSLSPHSYSPGLHRFHRQLFPAHLFALLTAPLLRHCPHR